jgi:hypothetical protein
MWTGRADQPSGAGTAKPLCRPQTFLVCADQAEKIDQTLQAEMFLGGIEEGVIDPARRCQLGREPLGHLFGLGQVARR